MSNQLTILQLSFLKKSITLLCWLCFFFTKSQAQYNIQFVITIQPASHSNDTIYLAGNFNRWNPAGNSSQFIKEGNVHVLRLTNMPKQLYEFKLTRGSWEKVEAGAAGTSLLNRQLNIESDTTVELNIEAWEDDFVKVTKRHTASSNVMLMDTAFAMPQLGRSRRIWLYLPDGYASNKKKKYPVLYMQDGQNLFDDVSAAYGEWGVDECLDSIIKNGRPACIVVGIDNGPQRMNEYNPDDHEKFGIGEGRQYIEFIANTLKPYIDGHYRTLPAKDYTLIAGSSMGGLISLYAMMQYPDVFGKAGIFSPSIWAANNIDTLTDAAAGKLSGKLFFYAGGQEGEIFINDVVRIQEKIGKKSSAMIYAVVDKDGNHNEAAWRKWFPVFYNWAMADGWNIISNKAD